MMDLERIREWLIQQGIPESELDEVKESPVIKDIGESLALSLFNNESLGNMVIDLLIKIEMLEQRVLELEGEK